MKDALGNDIIIGNAYGFAKNKSGLNVIKLGTVEGQTAGLAVLEKAVKIAKKNLKESNKRTGL